MKKTKIEPEGDEEQLDSESTTEVMEGVGEGTDLNAGDDKPGFPEEPKDKLPDQSLHYKDIYMKSKTISSGGRKVQTQWQGKELDSGDMEDRYIYRTDPIKSNGSAPESRWQGKRSAR